MSGVQGAGAAPAWPATTLGILAGGEGSRLGGRNKALLHDRHGTPLPVVLRARFAGDVARVLLSANRDRDALAALGFEVVADRSPGIGPLAGLDALAAACTTPWLLTVPVDAMALPADLVTRLHAAVAARSAAVDVAIDGIAVEDDDGPQPLLALWRVAALRDAAAAAIAAGELAIHRLQARMRMPRLRIDGLRIGNLNTPGDLAEAGIDG